MMLKLYSIVKVLVIDAVIWVALLFGPTTTVRPVPTIQPNQTRLDVVETNKHD